MGRFTVRVLAVSPFEEEPGANEGYLPSLIVESAPAPGEGELSPAGFAIGALLFTEWAVGQGGDGALATRLRAILPRLRVATRGGQLGPGRYAAHRAGQRERYFHPREAATYEVAIGRDDAGLYVLVKSRVAKGPWTAAATLLEAATLAPYEALLRTGREEGLATLGWLEVAVERWAAGYEAGFPVGAWDVAGELGGPG